MNNESAFKVGDILEIPMREIIPRQYGSFSPEDTCRCLVVDVLYPGWGQVAYTFLAHKDGFRTYHIAGANQRSISSCAKRIGHIDISQLRYEDPERFTPDLITAFAGGWVLAALNQSKDNDYIDKKIKTITDAIDQKLKNEIEAVRKENIELQQKVACANELLEQFGVTLL